MHHHSRRSTRTAHRAVALGAGSLLLAALLPVTAAQASRRSCEDRSNDSYRKLLECVTVEGVRDHQEALQKIADNSTDPVYPGTRAAGTDGYADSVDHVTGLLRKAGYSVRLDPVEFDFAYPAVLTQLTPTAAEYATGPFSGTGSARVEGPVTPIDVNLTGDRSSTSGCEAEDFAGVDLGGGFDIALIQRGTCTFGLKAQNAQDAGAEAVVIFNQGNAGTGPGDDREGLLTGDATSLDLEGTQPSDLRIPVVGASFADGESLAVPGSTAAVEVRLEKRTDVSVIAELPGRNRGNVVMAGAHLDSVTEGPGINDDGSGAAALLETALMMAEIEPQNTLRFAWWAGEELGLLGSTDYVQGLSKAQRDRIALYMNYDMVGSPNHILMAYDADQSTFQAPVEIPKGSAAIEDLYESYYTLVGEPYDDTAFDGRSDYQAFIDAGIPSGGLFTGAEEAKTEAQQTIWGGTAGDAFDPCYHLACDTAANVDLHALEVNSDLIAFAMLTFAYSTEPVNGVEGRAVRGKRVDLPPPAGPEGTFPTTTGGAPGVPASA